MILELILKTQALFKDFENKRDNSKIQPILKKFLRINLLKNCDATCKKNKDATEINKRNITNLPVGLACC